MYKSLDEIIATRPRGVRRTARRGARAQVLGTAGPSPVARVRTVTTTPVANGVKSATAAPQPADKIIVSNLPQDVNETQVKELFHSTVGPLREVTLHYDSAGRSKGVAAVHFQRKGDGTKAYQQYNNRLIDGKRPMKIEIVVDPARPAPAASLVSRVAPAAAAPVVVTQVSTPRTGAPRGRRAVGRGPVGGSRMRKSERPPKSAADLDAEMEDYTASNAPAAA